MLVDYVNNGSLALSVDGSFTYTPDSGFLGNDAFTYVANDGTDDSNEATVTLQRISAPNQPPTANNDAAQTVFRTAVTINVLNNGHR